MPKPSPAHDRGETSSPSGAKSAASRKRTDVVRLVGARYRTMTPAEDRAAVATVAALMRALVRAGHGPPTADEVREAGA